MSEVAAKLTEDLWEEGGEPKPAGSYKFYKHSNGDGPHGLHFVCPCGCGDVLGVAFENPQGCNGPTWRWNGDREKPSTTPSIRRIGGCEWHWYLTDGVFRTC